jgi:membrane protease subunit (stomatin/prohibitin family)
MQSCSFDINCQLDIKIDGKSIKVVDLHYGFYDSDALDCADIDIEYDSEGINDDIVDIIDDALNTFFNKLKGRYIVTLAGTVLTVEYDSKTESASVHK